LDLVHEVNGLWLVISAEASRLVLRLSVLSGLMMNADGRMPLITWLVS